MKLPSWMLPAVVVAFLAARLYLGARLHAAERKRTGKGWFESVPVWTKALWVLTAIAVVFLYFWAPRSPKAGLAPDVQPSPGHSEGVLEQRVIERSSSAV